MLDLPEPLGPTIAENDWKGGRCVGTEIGGNKTYFVERANNLSTSVALEIDEDHHMNDEPLLRALGFF